jgi:pyridinium-3,5-biscarboxylic acid mononucleotide sulfurtransferase
MSHAAQKLQDLRAHLAGLGSTLVCFSGGIDSALVLAVAAEQLGARAVGMTAVSPSLPRSEREAAQQVAAGLGARHYFVDSHELSRPEYVANGADRCFHCKSELYAIAQHKAAEWHLENIVNGTNSDDLGDYRPGLRAAQIAAVQSPLVELGFHKQDVRDVAQILGLTIWSKPASACLASRIPYGTTVTLERLEQIERLEASLHELGFIHSRVRWQGPIARIEVSLDQLSIACADPTREAILRAGKDAGFTYVTLDLAGYRTGSHNELLRDRSLRVVS